MREVRGRDRKLLFFRVEAGTRRKEETGEKRKEQEEEKNEERGGEEKGNEQ